MDTSILDRYLLEAISTDSSKKSSTSKISDEMSQSFREFFEKFSSRQQSSQSVLNASFSSKSVYYEKWVSGMSDKLQDHFSSSAQLSKNLRETLNWFSESDGSRQDFIDKMDVMADASPSGAANVLRELFQSKGNISSALKQSAFANSIFYSSASTMQNGADSASGEGTSGLSFSSLSLSVQIQQLTAKIGGGASRLPFIGGFNSEYFASINGTLSAQASLSFSSASAISSLTSTSSTTLKINAMIQLLDPLVLDLDGDGIDLKPIGDGVVFDLKGDGEEVACGFVQDDDALLFLDENGDGVCSNGVEMFGDQQGHANGFAELATHDSNGDGVIDSKDEIYKELKVWNDNNGDGISRKDEVRSLSDAGVESISLGYRDTNEENNGNYISQRGFFRRFDGALRGIVDAQFRYQELISQNGSAGRQ